ncbi:Polysaccharide deacetylase [Candidatus Sulfobium mesophilum]|uniref:Polysaccharide deacetylase n=1 Tax=Candidatus Sulfobium mesophilum TaxID=2016548 RepID=A0A2U3QEB3_9BACT|nr:Polysaccharide deacetylase [Candidatus Sulfobium mesophilum]
MNFYLKSVILITTFLSLLWVTSPEGGNPVPKVRPYEVRVPILLYHRFGPAASDSMTVTTAVFRSHLQYIRDKGLTVIPLRQLVDYYLKKGPPPPPGSVVIVADDAHESVYTEMLPLVKKYHYPVTLFVYPSAISNASYAMTWGQLKEIKKTGLFDLQGHTFWHPNFKQEKKRLPGAEYEKFVRMQLRKSKERLEKELDVKVDMLAWPFGIYDDQLIRYAADSGYTAAFSIERRHAVSGDNVMKLPRYLMQNSDKGKVFEQIWGSPRAGRVATISGSI